MLTEILLSICSLINNINYLKLHFQQIFNLFRAILRVFQFATLAKTFHNKELGHNNAKSIYHKTRWCFKYL